MEAYIEMLHSYIAAHQPDFSHCDPKTLLDMLFCCYRQRSGVDPAHIRASFQTLDQMLNKLSFQENDAVFTHVCVLCGTYQESSFHEGLLVGFRLCQELSGGHS